VVCEGFKLCYYAEEGFIEGFEEVCRYVCRRGLRPIPFRLSTLADSFPPYEELYRFSEYVLKVALNYGQPLTKY
jgi:DNA repair photolyase